MKDSVTKIISALIIGSSITIGCSILAKSFIADQPEIHEVQQQTIEPGLMTEKEAAEYLNLPIEDLRKIIVRSEVIRTQISSYDTYAYIPFVLIEGNRFFNKSKLDQWIDYIMTHNRGNNNLYQ